MQATRAGAQPIRDVNRSIHYGIRRGRDSIQLVRCPCCAIGVLGEASRDADQRSGTSSEPGRECFRPIRGPDQPIRDAVQPKRDAVQPIRDSDVQTCRGRQPTGFMKRPTRGAKWSIRDSIHRCRH